MTSQFEHARQIETKTNQVLFALTVYSGIDSMRQWAFDTIEGPLTHF
jgi:hypothetical protein